MRQIKHKRSKIGRGQKCHWCERILQAASARSRLSATRDHTEPKSIGGEHTVWACWACNHLKRDMRPLEWSAFMRENKDWWKLCEAAPGPVRSYQ